MIATLLPIDLPLTDSKRQIAAALIVNHTNTQPRAVLEAIAVVDFYQQKKTPHYQPTGENHAL